MRNTPLVTSVVDVSEGLTVGIWKETIGNIPFLLKAAKTDTGIDVLAVPRLVANDNAEASIDISDEIPYPKQTVGPDGTVTSTSYDYESAGIRLKITPHIGEDNYLRLVGHELSLHQVHV